MSANLQPSIDRIREIVAEEIADAGGTVSDCFHDGRRLYLRAVLPEARDVRPQDAVHGGVAVMTTGDNLRVCPYIFRQVCRNGAILAQVIYVREVRRLPQRSEDIEWELREAVQGCTSPEVLSSAVTQMQSATTRAASHLVTLLPLLTHLRRFSELILAHFEREADRSAFGLMNAVTSVARDEPDPDTRWQLEELGGGILALLPLAPRCRAAAEQLVQA